MKPIVKPMKFPDSSYLSRKAPDDSAREMFSWGIFSMSLKEAS